MSDQPTIEQLSARVEDLERQVAAMHAREMRRLQRLLPEPPPPLVYVGGTAKVTGRTKCAGGELVTIEYSGGRIEWAKP